MAKLAVIFPIKETDLSLLRQRFSDLEAQSFKDFKLYIVFSEQKSKRLLKSIREMAQNISIEFLWDRSGSKGLSSDLCYAIKNTVESLIARIDLDDQIKPNHFALGISAIAAADLVACQDSMQENKGKKRKISQIFYLNPIIHSSVIMRRSSYEAVGGYSKNLRYCEDLDLWLRMIEKKMRLVILDTDTIGLRKPSSRSSENWKTNAKIRLSYIFRTGSIAHLLGVIIALLFMFLPDPFQSAMYKLRR